MAERFEYVTIRQWSVEVYAIYGYSRPYGELQILFSGTEKDCYRFITDNGLEYILQ